MRYWSASRRSSATTSGVCWLSRSIAAAGSSIAGSALSSCSVKSSGNTMKSAP